MERARRMRRIPPMTSARACRRMPKRLPSLTPMAAKKKLNKPMMKAAERILICKKEKDTPMTRASMLLAMANGSMAFVEKDAVRLLGSLRDCIIMLTPMRMSRVAMSQCSRICR